MTTAYETQSMQQVQDDIVSEFESLKDWDDKYKHIIKLGKELPELPEEKRQEKYLVKGCQSQVWMIPEPSGLDLENLKVYFHVDSDAMIVRGLISLIMRLYNGRTPAEILSTKPDFIERIEMGKHLSMQRSNGLAAMIKQIQMYAMALKLRSESS